MGTFTITQAVTHEKVYLSCISDGCINDFSKYLPSGFNYDKVDDERLSPDEDDTYVYSDVTSILSDYYIVTDPALTGDINYVKVFSRAKTHNVAQSADGIFKILITDSSTFGSPSDVSKSDDIDLTTDYTSYSKIWTENPRTVTDWTWSDISNLQIGMECTSPLIAGVDQTITNTTNADGDTIQLRPSDEPLANYKQVETQGSMWVEYDIINDGDSGTLLDLYNFTNQAGSGTITKISAFIYCSLFVHTPAGEFHNAKIALKTGGSTFYSDVHKVTEYVSLGAPYSFTWTENPDTSTTWQWGDLTNLQVGISIDDSGTSSLGMRCYFVKFVVDYFETNVTPNIRTTQAYAMVDYDFNASCTLNKPDEISTNHSSNVNMLNFWNGEREVYAISRSSKGMVFKGVEWETACTKIQCMRDMGLRGQDIVISGLTPNVFNGTFKIASFGWKQTSKSPEVFEWILQLEDAEL